MIIAIDGPAGTGKSTVAKGVAKALGFTFFDTGAMYRSFAWHVKRGGVDPLNEERVVGLIASFDYEIRTDFLGERDYFIGDVRVTEEIRSREISKISSQIAVYPDVRAEMVKMQRKFGKSCDAVFEGRDMGTVVFPDADLKIFLTAKPVVRAERRYQELRAKFPEAAEPLSLTQILEEMEGRDLNDSTRSISPLKQASDAILIDTSHCTASEVIEKIVRLKPKKKNKFSSMKLSYFLVYCLARGFFKTFFRLKIYGQEHVHAGPGLLIANHTSFYDPPILSISCSEEVHFLAKESLFEVPLLGRLIQVLNTHPLTNDATDMHVLRQMIRFLGEGKKLIIFPEGSRSEDGTLQPFERGFSFLAKKAKCTVFPCYIGGAYEAWPISQKFPSLFGKISCVFGSPIEWEDFENLPKDEAEKEHIQRCFLALSELKGWLESGAHGTPP